MTYLNLSSLSFWRSIVTDRIFSFQDDNIMLTIVHGDDEVASRNFFISQKDKDSLTFDAENLSLIELEQSLSGSGLFGTSNKIFIENLFSRKASGNFDEISPILNKKNKTDIFIWADKILSIKNLSLFLKSNVKIFKIPQNIWSFLDGIKPNNPRNVSSFHSTISTNEPEIVFAMIIRQFRLMLGLSESSNNNIDEVKRLAPWQKSKLIRQASLLGVSKLKQIYEMLYKIDKSQKTGSTNLTLTQSIDILLLDL